MIAIALALVFGAPVRMLQPPSPEAVSREMTDAEVRERIDVYLRSIDAPVELAQWQALGTRALPALEEIARDRSALPTRRAQALSALGQIGGPQANALLADLSAREDEHLAVRMAAVRALGAAGAIETLRPLLEKASDARVRAVAAEQLVERSGKSACPQLQALAAAEKDPVRPLFAKALAACF